MIDVKFKVISWDWREQPDWEEINDWLKELNCRPYFYEVNTGSDSYAVLIANTPLLTEEVELLYED